MKSMVRRVSCLAAMACFAWIARAGVMIQQEGAELGGNQQKQKMTFYIQSGKLRMDMDTKDGKTTVIFDGDKQILWMLNPAEGTYRELNGQQMDQMAQQMNNAMQQMQARLGNMPPEQRKMVEDMMKQQMGRGAAAAPEITVQEKGSEKVASFDTTHYAVLSNGQLTQEVWAASPGQIHVDESEFKTFQAMAKFWEPLRRNAPAGSWSASAMQQIKGMPVKTVVYQGQRPSFEWDVVKVEQKGLDNGLFTLPAGMKKQEMMPPGMGMGMGQGMGQGMGR